MRYRQENLNNIKQRISAETGVIMNSGGYEHGARRMLIALALVLALGTMAIFAAKRFEISRNVLLSPAAQSGEALDGSGSEAGDETQAGETSEPPEDGSPESLTDSQQLSGFRISYPFELNTNEYTISKYAHKGIDIEAPKGTPVLAAADGTVRVCEFKPDYGYYVIIDHADGYSTLYAHMEGYSVEQGQELKAGDQIGTVGATGMATGPHLHLELRGDDEPIDPMDYFE
ncbi:MAG: M23 family metallopeptidase [Firmicutes bacterium]|nr:M23 family metallopeptidase [Bacillota bacterium]